MKTAFLVKAAGQLVPSEEMKKLLHEMAPVAAGFAAAAVSDGKDTVMIEHWPDLKEKGDNFETILNSFNTLQEEMKDFEMIAAFTTDPGKVTTNAENEIETPHMPPFSVLEGDNGVIHLAAVLAGDFGESKDGIPSTFNALSVLTPGIKKSFRLLKQDVSALMDEFREDTELPEQLEKLSDSGVISFIGSNGELFVLPSKDGLLTTAPWGFTTYIPKPAETAKPMGSGLAARAKGLVRNLTKTAETERKEPVIDATKADPTGAKKPDTAVTPPITYYQYPDKGHSKDQKRQGYLKNAGYIPQGFKNCPKVEVKFPVDTKDLKQLGKVQEVKAAANADAEPAPANIKVTSIKGSAKPALPIIPVAMKEELINDPVVLQTLDKASGVVTPLVIANDEEKYPSFFEQTGLEVSDLYHWSEDEIEQFTAKYQQPAAVLIINLLALHARHEQQQGKDTPATKPEPTVEETKPTPTVAPSPASGLKVRPKLAARRAVG